MNTFAVNGITYKAKAFDFNMLCDLEDLGVSIEQAQDKPLSMARAYFALCTGKGNEYAGKQIEEHIIKGGNFDDIMNAMSKEMDESDFFRNLNKAAKTEVAEVEEKTTAKKK